MHAMKIRVFPFCSCVCPDRGPLMALPAACRDTALKCHADLGLIGSGHHGNVLVAQLIEEAGELMGELVKGVASAANKGVTELGAAVWVNGLLVTSSEGVPWEQMVPYQLQIEQQRIQAR